MSSYLAAKLGYLALDLTPHKFEADDSRFQ